MMVEVEETEIRKSKAVGNSEEKRAKQQQKNPQKSKQNSPKSLMNPKTYGDMP